eukprot:gene11539-21872_t
MAEAYSWVPTGEGLETPRQHQRPLTGTTPSKRNVRARTTGPGAAGGGAAAGQIEDAIGQ